MSNCKYYCASKKFQYFASGSATVGAFGLGTVLAWSSPAMPSMESTDPKDKYYIALEQSGKSWVASIATLGALVSGPLAGFLMTRIGIKTTMLLITSPFVLGWLLITYAKSLVMLLSGRFLTGFCGGAISLLAPIFIGENVQSCHRGLLASFFQLMVVMGILFTYAFGAFLTYQYLSLVCCFAPLVFIIFMIFMPESPRFLLTTGQVDDGAQALAWLRGAKSRELIQEELRAIAKSVEETHETEFRLKELFTNPRLYRPTIVTTLILVFQQISGINTVIFFTDDLVKYAQIRLSSDVVRILIGSLQPITTIICALFVDRLGRRPLLISSAVAMTICHLILGIYFTLVWTEHEIVEGIRWLPAVTLVVLVLGFGLGLGGIPWVLASELLNRRGIEWTSPIPTCANWASAFFVTMFFEVVREATDLQWIYFGHSLVCAVASIYVYFFLPETKGKSLEEIQDMF